MRRPRVIIVAAALLVLAILIYAWADAGREPLRPIVTTVRPDGA